MESTLAFEFDITLTDIADGFRRLAHRAWRSRGRMCRRPTYLVFTQALLHNLRTRQELPGTAELSLEQESRVRGWARRSQEQLRYGLPLQALDSAVAGLIVAPHNTLLLVAAGHAILALGGAEVAARFFSQALWVNRNCHPAQAGLDEIADIDLSGLRSEFFDERSGT